MLDKAVFKRLAHNDTGAAAGHQGGIVIPRDIASFFPPLRGTPSAIDPTLDRRLTAEMFVDGRFVGTADTRFQYQTWGGTRSPERRLTDNLSPMRNEATAGDIVLFYKDLTSDDRITISLIRQNTAEFDRLDTLLDGRRWGPVDEEDPPIRADEIIEAENYIAQIANEPVNLFRSEETFTESRTMRVSRNRAFRLRVLEEYDFRCGFSGRAFENPSGGFGLDAAHIIPVNKLGSDHPGNGIPLTKDLHWAFDQGLFGVNDNRRIVVPVTVSTLSGNEFLASLDGVRIREADNEILRASPDAFRWHRENVLLSE